MLKYKLQECEESGQKHQSELSSQGELIKLLMQIVSTAQYKKVLMQNCGSLAKHPNLFV